MASRSALQNTLQEVPQDEMKGKLDHNLQEGRKSGGYLNGET